MAQTEQRDEVHAQYLADEQDQRDSEDDQDEGNFKVH